MESRLHRSIPARVGALGAGCLLLVACGGSGDAQAGDDELRVAFVTPESTGEYYGAMYCGAKDAAAENDIDLTIQGTPEVTVDAQMEVLQSVLATAPDGLLLVVWDTEAFNGVAGEYAATGSPIVMPDSFISAEEHYLQSIRTDSYQSSYDAALEVIEEHGLESGRVLINTDSPGNAIQSARAEGFRDAVVEHTDLEVLEFQYVGGDSAQAASAVTSAAAASEDLVLVFSTNIGAGTGSANGIATTGGSTVHVGYDASSSQVEQLRSGEYDALIAQSPYQMGYDSMALIASALRGDVTESDIDDKTLWSPWALVTEENVDDEDLAPFLYTTDCAEAS